RPESTRIRCDAQHAASRSCNAVGTGSSPRPLKRNSQPYGGTSDADEVTHPSCRPSVLRMFPTRALLAAAVAMATHTAGSAAAQRIPIPPSPPTDLRDLTVQELLARMPADPVERGDHGW